MSREEQINRRWNLFIIVMMIAAAILLWVAWMVVPAIMAAS